jgi:UDP-N-acetylmuramyl pentapeptide phosphotransferase/UDP-N-acetylglucosamine-1-phosphate transferase
LGFAVPHLALLIGGFVSFAICLGIVLTKRLHGQHTLDLAAGIQKVHSEPTPRIGGLAIFVGLCITWVFTPPLVAVHLQALLLASLPAFLAGTLEDLSKRDKVSERLLATFLSGILAWWLTGVSLTRIGIPGFDFLLSIVPISVIFTAFAISGVANAVNIIDGLNGLAGGVVLVCLCALGVIAFRIGDVEMAKLCLVLTAAIFGFMLVNYPRGKIFLGDGGAYLLGFLLGWCAVMIAMRNPGISPWGPLLACGYPILEVLFSMARRRARKLKIGQPDRLHLHSLLWARLTRKWFKDCSPTIQNASVLPLILLYALIPASLAVIFSTSTPKLVFAFVISAYIYALIYARLVHFSWTLPKLRLAKRGRPSLI